MKSTTSNKIVLALAGAWMAAFAAHTGCESSANLGALPGVGDIRSDVVLDAHFAQAPMFVAPDSVTQRTNFVDVSSEVPVDGQTVQFELPSDAVAFQADASDSDLAGDIGIEMVIAGGDNRSAPIRKTVGTMLIQRGADGASRVTRTSAPTLGPEIVKMLGDGPVSINVIVTSDLYGAAKIDGAKIRIGFGGLPVNGNSAEDDNANDNAGDDMGNDNTGAGNANDNTGDDMGNDNAGDDMGNDNTGAGNTNDNTGDDMGNDNAGDDMGNDNTGAGNTNDNTGDDMGNDNAGDDMGNDNTGAGNTNDNTGDDMGNDNAGDDTGNDNTGAGNGNDNTDDNGNDNTGNDNGNDNTSSGLCPDGSLQLRVEVESADGSVVEARYDELGPDCRRFRLEIEGFASGWYDVFVNDVFVGEIFADSDDGEGRLRLETDNGNFPAGFPAVAAGDVVSVGDVIDVVLQTHCSGLFLCSNSNGNDNTGGNTNDNTGGNANDNTAGNTNDNGA